jgi:hypothetical protein
VSFFVFIDMGGEKYMPMNGYSGGNGGAMQQQPMANSQGQGNTDQQLSQQLMTMEHEQLVTLTLQLIQRVKQLETGGNMGG